MNTTQHNNVTGGVAAALIFLLIFGLIIGLPLFVWPLLIAAIIGFAVATRGTSTGKTDVTIPDRPWRR